MRVKTVLLAAALSLCTTACVTAPAVESSVDKAHTKFAATFHNVPIDSVKVAEIPGLFEIYTGGKIIYYAPDQDLMIFGEVYTLSGTSITAEKTEHIVVEKSRSIDRSKGLSVGDGPIELVAFVSPDCGYCIQAQRWFDQRDYKNAKVDFFFLPMEKGSQAYARALQAVCAPPELRREAVRQTFMPGSTVTPLTASCPDGPAMLDAQAKIAKESGVTATPVFIVNGQTVLGFKQDQLEALLSSPAVN